MNQRSTARLCCAALMNLHGSGDRSASWRAGERDSEFPPTPLANGHPLRRPRELPANARMQCGRDATQDPTLPFSPAAPDCNPRSS
jgi:hypothetical protein